MFSQYRRCSRAPHSSHQRQRYQSRRDTDWWCRRMHMRRLGRIVLSYLSPSYQKDYTKATFQSDLSREWKCQGNCCNRSLLSKVWLLWNGEVYLVKVVGRCGTIGGRWKVWILYLGTSFQQRCARSPINGHNPDRVLQGMTSTMVNSGGGMVTQRYKYSQDSAMEHV